MDGAQIAQRSLQAVSALAWLAVLYRAWHGRRPWFWSTAREIPPWGLIDLALVIVVWAGILSAAQFGLSQLWHVEPGTSLDQLAPPIALRWILGNAAALIVATALGMLAITWRSDARLADWWGPRWPGSLSKWLDTLRDIGTGGGAFLLLAGPVLGLQELLTRHFPTRHPLVELLAAHPRGDLLLAVGVSAVLVSPIVEELQFRVLLQGWFARIAETRPSIDELLQGSDAPARRQGRAARWPIVASAAVFALAHATHGPDPIPLFLFALGLGALYHRTRRLLPIIVCHALLNAWSWLLLTQHVLRPST